MGSNQLAILGGPRVRSRPWPKWPRADDETLEAVREVLSSSRWAISGPYDGRTCFERRFASAFAEFHGVEFCTPTTSGTAALTIALHALGIGFGDAVLVPGLTWVACASSVVSVGATPMLVDVDPDTLAMSPERAVEALSSRTAAILLVHPYCSIADLDAFSSIAEKRGIPLIEDCAQAHGARWRDRPVGTFGAVGCFSMQQSKLLTSGEGGAVITRNPRLYERLEQLRCDGRIFGDQPELGQLELIEVGAVQGRNYCLSELQAAVLFERLAHLPEENAVRAKRVRHLAARLEDIEGVSMLPADARVTNRTFYNLILRVRRDLFQGNTIDAIARAVSAELGTLVSPVYVPLSRHKLLYRDGDARRASLDPSTYPLPECERARDNCLALTQQMFLDDEAGMNDIVRAIAKVQECATQLLGTSQEPARFSF